jgi:hypothetical protein
MNVPLPRRISTRPRLKIPNSPTDGDATDPESHNEAVFGWQLVADLQVSIGNLASEDCFDPCKEKRVTRR